ncbi:alpha/beta fold hydrolase [Croceicoccus mobilis]|uniref:Lysophospholipase n=1 Tax=Croceicoccus mobilis TaxID=1703339 RepID=A0A916YQJ4_9SPHN|nr:alpha/beta hydrolase [Croceicoccus mobilis]GGD56439.1 lysophospholipase [Croceicoccus mobilis]
MKARISDTRRSIPTGATESVWHAADGHPIRRIDWPGINAAETGARDRGAILFLGGRGDHYEKYLETLDHWHRQGWAVTSIDWRGQAGSGRLGSDSMTGHVADFSHWISDLRDFWADWSARHDSGPRVLVGHSMGGHLSLRAVGEGAVSPDALVLVAPMLGFAGPPLPPAMWHAATIAMTALGPRHRPAWKAGEKPASGIDARQSLLTHDKSRYDDEHFWRQARPELQMGAPSWGWLERAAESMRRTARADFLKQVNLPVLVLSTSADRLVSARAIRRAVNLLPDAEHIEFGPESAHEILRESDDVRDRALQGIADFLDRHVPAGAAA